MELTITLSSCNISVCGAQDTLNVSTQGGESGSNDDDDDDDDDDDYKYNPFQTTRSRQLPDMSI